MMQKWNSILSLCLQNLCLQSLRDSSVFQTAVDLCWHQDEDIDLFNTVFNRTNSRSLLFMENIEDTEDDNYVNETRQSDNESDDNFAPNATKKCVKNKRARKRSASLPFIEDNTGFYKGLVVTKGLQLTKGIRNCQRAWKQGRELQSDSDDEDEMLATMCMRGNDGCCSTRRSSSMPEFSQFSRPSKTNKRKISTRQTTQKQCGSGSRGERKQNSPLATAENAEQVFKQKDDTFRLPTISTSAFSKGSQEQLESREIKEVGFENMKIQRKTYLPRINSNSGNVFMKSR